MICAFSFPLSPSSYFCLLYSKFCILHPPFKDDPHWTGRGWSYRDWFRQEAGRDERYNYLYSAEGLDQQTDLLSTIKEKAKEVYVTYNNHFQGQAVVNALQLRHRLEDGVQQIPDPLLQAYPQMGRLLEG